VKRNLLDYATPMPALPAEPKGSEYAATLPPAWRAYLAAPGADAEYLAALRARAARVTGMRRAARAASAGF
jgi:hypothetical protein